MSKKSVQPAQEAIEPRAETRQPDYETIAVRAFQLWVSRGCPIGSPELDWERAEQELMEEGQTAERGHSQAA